MKGGYVQINTQDDLPRCGSGVRRFVQWEGRKWVYLYYIPRAQTERITKKKYEELKPRVLKVGEEFDAQVVMRQIQSAISSGQGNSESGKTALDVIKVAA